ncbi:MAG: TIGR03009 domain-containing protein, partial [Fimbriiglobus sp.]
MRRAGLVLTAVLFAAPAVFAQIPPAVPADRVPVPGAGTPVGLTPGGVPVGLPVAAGVAPAPTPVDPAIVAHLDAWQRVMKQTTNFYAEATMTKRHLILKDKVTAYTGTIMCLKPNLARMRIEQKPPAGEKPDPNSYMAYICTGQAVFEYDGAAKQVTEFPLNGGVGDNLLLAFISGALTAEGIMQRFDLKLVKEDQHYVYLEARPRLPRDKQEFETMTLVLFRATVPQLAYLPRSVVMRKSNGQEEEHWDFPQPRVNVEGIKPEHFQPVAPPKDWKVQRQQAQQPPAGQPRVARPQGQ